MNFISACGLIMIFFIYENLVGSNSILEKTSSRLCKTKTKYMMCKFRKIKKKFKEIFKIKKEEVLRSKWLRYFSYVIQHEWKIAKKNIAHKIKVGWFN